MKKKLTKKLSLNKKTVALLSNKQQMYVQGGEPSPAAAAIMWWFVGNVLWEGITYSIEHCRELLDSFTDACPEYSQMTNCTSNDLC